MKRLPLILSLISVIVLFSSFVSEASNRICPRQLKAECGRTSSRSKQLRDNRIAGGRDAKPGEYPSFVSLRIRIGFEDRQCSGVLIDTDVVLTAAHCVTGFGRIHSVRVGLGISPPQSWHSSGTQVIHAKFVCPSPNYNARLFIYDYAVIRLNRSVRLSKDVQTACLPRRPLPTYGQAAAVGVGIIDSSNRNPRVAQVLGLQNVGCPFFEQGSTHICFRSKYYGNVCPGDSGGPIYATEDGKMTVVALTSYGHNRVCFSERVDTAVFADVYKQRDHILDLVERCQ